MHNHPDFVAIGRMMSKTSESAAITKITLILQFRLPVICRTSSEVASNNSALSG